MTPQNKSLGGTGHFEDSTALWKSIITSTFWDIGASKPHACRQSYSCLRGSCQPRVRDEYLTLRVAPGWYRLALLADAKECRLSHAATMFLVCMEEKMLAVQLTWSAVQHY